MSEQPLSVAPSVTATTSNLRRPSILDLHDIGALLTQVENVADEATLVTDCKSRVGWRHLCLAHEKEVDVVRGQSVVERAPYQIARARRPHEARGYDDGEIGFILLISLARE